MDSQYQKPALGAQVVDQSHPRMKGRYRQIFLAFGILTIPMILLSGLLLGLIFSHRVSHGSAVSSNLNNGDVLDEPGVIYVKLSATTLATVASWSSTLAPTLIG